MSTEGCWITNLGECSAILVRYGYKLEVVRAEASAERTLSVFREKKRRGY